ncbi:MAG TPA: hypothetical protein VM925_26885 [Labilithrix sp.]|nr:hypothetical protein [Labilithrix sp.]
MTFAAAAAITAACAFPDPKLGDDANDRDARQATDASTDAPFTVTIDGQDPNTLIVRDAGKKFEAGQCPPSVCDCDQDSFFDLSRAECADAGGAVRDASDPANDCDDFDSRTRPGQGFLEAPSEPPRHGDWNCKNGVEKLYPVNVKCAGLLVSVCNGINGFSGDPDCGVEDEFVACQLVPPLNATCGIGQRTTRTQACK